MKNSTRFGLRTLLTTAAAIVGLTLATKFAVVAPIVGVVERAAEAKICQTVWAGVDVQEVEVHDPTCARFVGNGGAR